MIDGSPLRLGFYVKRKHVDTSSLYTVKKAFICLYHTKCMRLPKMNWTFFIAGFCMVTGVLLPIGIAILVFWFYRDVKKFIKPEWSYTKDMFSSETKEELK